MPIRRRAFLALLAGAGGLQSASRALANSAEASSAPAGQLRTLRYSLKVNNPTSKTVKAAEVRVFAPVRQGTWHRRVEVRSAPSHALVEGAAGNATLRFDLDALAPYATLVLQIEADVELFARPQRSPAPPLGMYRGAEQMLEVEDRNIGDLADSLRRPNPRDTVRNMFDWTRQNIRYVGYVVEAQGARGALESRKGDCTEYAYLSVALVRAAGLQARVVGGFVVSGQQRLRATAYHDWAEVYLEGQWVLLDAQVGLLDPKENANYVAFEYLSPQGEAVKLAARRFSASTPILAEFL